MNIINSPSCTRHVAFTFTMLEGCSERGTHIIQNLYYSLTSENYLNWSDKIRQMGISKGFRRPNTVTTGGGSG